MVDLLRLRVSEVEDVFLRMDSKQIAKVVKQLAEDMLLDCDKWADKGQRLAAKRLRKRLNILRRAYSPFRRKSIYEAKENDFIE